MSKLFLVSAAFILNTTVFAQIRKEKGLLGISVPVIWNNSEATFYRLGSPEYPKGKAVSFGLNIHYSRPLYKNLYGRIGLGYFKQCFKIIRPFDYNSGAGQLLYSTQSYNYNNIQLFAGVGYVKKIGNTTLVNGFVNINHMLSFNQKYIVDASSKERQVNSKFFSSGEFVSFDLGIEKMLSKKVSIGFNLLIPLYTHWNKDDIFINSNYSDDEQQIARNRFSIGMAASLYYHF